MILQQNRRQILRGLGSAMALPILEYFHPQSLAFAAGPVQRILFCYIGNGAQWTPSSSGTGFTLPSPLSSLEPIKDYVTVISGLKLGPAYSNRGGDHARAAGSWLTGKTPDFPGPSNLVPSLDTQIAKVMGAGMRYANLCLGADNQADGDSGYSALFSNHISWLGGGSANTQETDPGRLFQRILAMGGTARLSSTGPLNLASNISVNKSVLDFVLAEARSLNQMLGSGDRSRLEEYMTEFRALELRLNKVPSQPRNPTPTQPRNPTPTQPRNPTPAQTPTTLPMPTVAEGCGNMSQPGTNLAYQQKVGLLYDVLFQAWVCGLNNVATYLLVSETSHQSYGFIGVPGDHHSVSHDASPNGYAGIAKIVGWHISNLSSFCQKLKATPEGSGNMLDNSLIIVGGGLGDGTQHSHTNIPTLIIGKGGGTVPGGRHIQTNGTPFCNVQLAIAKAVGLSINNFGDSSGVMNFT